MAEITVMIGSVVGMSNGAQQDTRRAVRFEGEELGTYREYGTDSRNPERLTDTRGTTETLYRVADGRLVVHVDEWSRWQGEPNTEWLTEITKADLSPGGPFEALGAAYGFGRPLTLDEALSVPTLDEDQSGPYGEFRGQDVSVHKELSQADFPGGSDGV